MSERQRSQTEDEAALLEAVLEGQTANVQDLLASGVDPNAAWNYVTLFGATQGELPLEIIEHLIEAGADPNGHMEISPLTNDEMDGLQGALLDYLGEAPKDKDLVPRPTSGDREVTTALHLASEVGHVGLVRLLVRAPVDLEARVAGEGRHL